MARKLTKIPMIFRRGNEKLVFSRRINIIYVVLKTRTKRQALIAIHFTSITLFLFSYNSAGTHKKAIAEPDEYKPLNLNTIRGLCMYPLGQIN